MDERNFINALSRAQQLIHDSNFNKQVEIGAAFERGKGNRGNSSDLAGLDAMVFGVGTSTPPSQPAPQMRMVAEQQSYNEYEPIQQIQPQPRDMSKSKLPKEILESFATAPTPDAYFENEISKLDGLDALMGTRQKQVVNEVARPQNTQRQAVPQYVPQGGGSIDYDYIKFLIKESVKEALKGSLNESASLNSMRGMCIGEGNVIQFLDKRGNVYEGKLVLKKKAKNN